MHQEEIPCRDRQSGRSSCTEDIRTYAVKIENGACCSRISAAVERLSLTLAIGDYEHTRDLRNGAGAHTRCQPQRLNLSRRKRFFSLHLFREVEVSEMSMGQVLSLRSRQDSSIAAIPCFLRGCSGIEDYVREARDRPAEQVKAD